MIKLINAKTEVRKVAYGSIRSGVTFEHPNGVIMIKTDHNGDCGWVASVDLTTGSRYSIKPDEMVTLVELEAKVVSRG